MKNRDKALLVLAEFWLMGSELERMLWSPAKRSLADKVAKEIVSQLKETK